MDEKLLYSLILAQKFSGLILLIVSHVKLQHCHGNFSYIAKMASGFENIKGELKAEISNFSNIFFGKASISKVKLVELFPLVSCFFCEKIMFEVGLFLLLQPFHCGLTN